MLLTLSRRPGITPQTASIIGDNMSKYVYIAKCSDYEYKIGVSDDPEARVKQLQTGNPSKITLVSSYESENAEITEHKLHSLLESYALRGEWFKIPDCSMSALLTFCRVLGVDDTADWMGSQDRKTTLVIRELVSLIDDLSDGMQEINERIDFIYASSAGKDTPDE